jgi:hypothetical protein
MFTDIAVQCTCLTLMIYHGVCRSCSFPWPSFTRKWGIESYFVHCINQRTSFVIGMLYDFIISAPLFQRYLQTLVMCPKTSQT